MRAFERYESYKSSNIEWIGDIPSHWDCVRIKSLTSVKRGASPRPIDDPKYFDANGEFSWVRIADVTANNHYLLTTTQTLSKLGSSLSVKIYPNELFLSIAGSVGKPMISKIKCCIHDGFVYFPDLEINVEFLYRIFETGLPFIGLGKFGTQLNLNTETVANIRIPLPPLEEQKQIADFLDIKSKQIDEFIADKQALIALFEEQKSAIINEAVTKGLNKTASLKPSGIEWIGNIPSHWEAKKLKFSTLINNKTLTDKTDKDYVIQYVDIGNVDKNGLVGEPEQLRFEDAPSRARRIVSDGDTIISTVRTYLKALAYFERADDNLIASTGFAVLTSGEKCDEKFLYYFVSSDYFIQQVSYRAVGIMYPSIGLYDIGSIKLLLPPLEEQKQIVEYLQKELSKIDTLIETAKAEITLIEEYKTSLINEVVTGKIKIKKDTNEYRTKLNSATSGCYK